MQKHDRIVTVYRARAGSGWVFEAIVFVAAGIGRRLGLLRELEGQASPSQIGRHVVRILEQTGAAVDAQHVQTGSLEDDEGKNVLRKWKELEQLNQPSRAFRRFAICEVLDRPGRASWLVQEVVPSEYPGCTTWGAKRRVRHSAGPEALGTAIHAVTVNTSHPSDARHQRSARGRRTKR